jgi:hypothetical protein
MGIKRKIHRRVPNHPSMSRSPSEDQVAYSQGNQRRKDHPAATPNLVVRPSSRTLSSPSTGGSKPWQALLVALVRAREIDSLAVFSVDAALEWSLRANGLLLGELV